MLVNQNGDLREMWLYSVVQSVKKIRGGKLSVAQWVETLQTSALKLNEVGILLAGLGKLLVTKAEKLVTEVQTAWSVIYAREYSLIRSSERVPELSLYANASEIDLEDWPPKFLPDFTIVPDARNCFTPPKLVSTAPLPSRNSNSGAHSMVSLPSPIFERTPINRILQSSSPLLDFDDINVSLDAMSTDMGMSQEGSMISTATPLTLHAHAPHTPESYLAEDDSISEKVAEDAEMPPVLTMLLKEAETLSLGNEMSRLQLWHSRSPQARRRFMWLIETEINKAGLHVPSRFLKRPQPKIRREARKKDSDNPSTQVLRVTPPMSPTPLALSDLPDMDVESPLARKSIVNGLRLRHTSENFGTRDSLAPYWEENLEENSFLDRVRNAKEQVFQKITPQRPVDLARNFAMMLELVVKGQLNVVQHTAYGAIELSCDGN